MTEFKFDTMFPLGEDTTAYRLLTKEHVRVRLRGVWTFGLKFVG